LGTTLDWIGASLSLSRRSIWLAIPEHKVAEVASKLRHLAGARFVKSSDLARLAGLLSFYAGIVVFLRPFVRMSWAAASSPTSSGWIKARRATHALSWLIAFFRGTFGALEREFAFAAPPTDTSWEMVVDASLWGGGGALYDRKVLVAWYSVTWSPDLHTRFNRIPGQSANMGWLEALNILVGARTWEHRFSQTAVRVKNDNMAALQLSLSLASGSPELNAIGAELALDIALQRYSITLAGHIPGVSNDTADALSRLSAPVPRPMPRECRIELRVNAANTDADDFWHIGRSFRNTQTYRVISEPN